MFSVCIYIDNDKCRFVDMSLLYLQNILLHCKPNFVLQIHSVYALLFYLDSFKYYSWKTYNFFIMGVLSHSTSNAHGVQDDDFWLNYALIHVKK